MQGRAQQLLAIYDQAEVRLLQVMKEADPEWSRRKMDELKAAQTAMENIINGVTDIGGTQAKKLMNEAFYGGAQAFLDEAKALGITLPKTLVAVRLDQLLALQGELENKITTIGHAILRDAMDKYREIVGDTLTMGLTHVENSEQLMQRTLNRFADEGITGFTDKAGRRWGMGEYTEMATRTGMMHASLAGYATQAQQYGFDLVIVTDHADECPLCRPWENRILSLTGAERSNPECTGTINEATAAGLFHPNCGHSYNVYIPGASLKTGGDTQSEARNEKGYAARQMQRYCERQLRRWNRRKAVAMDAPNLFKANSRIQELEDTIEQLIDKYNLKRRPMREVPYTAVTINGRKITL